jgi:S1-C subfamily serine protease
VGVVTKGSPAQVSGLEAGDTIVRVDSLPVDSIADVLAIVSTRSPGQALSLQFRRAHRLHTVPVTLASRTVPPSSGK